MFTKFGWVIRSVIPTGNCFFFDASNKLVISDAAGNDGGVLDRITTVGSNHVDQGFHVISYSNQVQIVPSKFNDFVCIFRPLPLHQSLGFCQTENLHFLKRVD